MRLAAVGEGREGGAGWQEEEDVRGGWREGVGSQPTVALSSLC